jgi:hypothetical protein
MEKWNSGRMEEENVEALAEIPLRREKNGRIRQVKNEMMEEFDNETIRRFDNGKMEEFDK